MESTERLQEYHARKALQTILQTTAGIVLSEFVADPTLPSAVAQNLADSNKTEAVPTLQLPLTMTVEERQSLCRDWYNRIGSPTECLFQLPTLSATIWVRLQITEPDWLFQFWYAHPEQPFTIFVQHPAPALLVVYHEEYFVEVFVFNYSNM